MITIVDYGMGNLGSVLNMFKKIGAKAYVTDDLEEIKKAGKLLLPGVGAFDAAMQRINDRGLKDVLNEKALDENIPILGICLGMQLLTDGSEEGKMPGLGWIKGKAIRFDFPDNTLKVPHMGWNITKAVRPSPLTKNLQDDARFYFVHSYYVKADSKEDVLMRTEYGFDFDSVIWNRQNIFGAQFHPEKSHKYGMKLFENFAAI